MFICAFSGSRGSTGGITFSTVPGFVVFAVDMAVLRISLVDGWRGRNELFRLYSAATVDNSQTMRIDPLFHSGEQFVLDAEGRRRRDLSQRIALARY